jgi:protocatechuate 3,4-dioxygenase beta subunit
MHTSLPAWFVLLPVLLRAQGPPAPTPANAEEPRVTAPLPENEPRLAPLLARAKEAAKAGADGAALLATKEFEPLRELKPFRELVREYAPRGEVRIPPPGEPGTALTVRGSVQDRHGKAVADALVYAYHTSSKGWYSDRAPHFISEGGGDMAHARLFGYVRTGADGTFVLRTIRPAGYPRSDLPEHIHLHIVCADQEVLVTEMLFEDDARLTASVRERMVREGCVVAKPARGADGAQVVNPEFTVEVPAPAKGR